MRPAFDHYLCLLLLLLVSASVALAQSDDLVLIDQTSSGNYEIDAETRLVIQGISGTLSIRAGKPGSMQFEGRALDTQRSHLAVALWRSGKHTLMLGPGAEVPEEGTLIDMAIPPELKVEVVITDGSVMASGLFGDLKVEAKGSRVQARGLRGGAELTLHGGQLAVDGIKLPFIYNGTDVKATVKHLYDDATLNLSKGELTLAGAEGGVEGVFEETHVSLDRIEGRVRLEGNLGSLRLAECNGGGELQLEETPLSLRMSKGDFDVRTDASMEFDQHDGPLDIVSYGGEISGSNTLGPLTLESDSAKIMLKQLGGQSEIRGSGLELDINTAKGPVTVNTVSSDLSINVTKSDLIIDNDFGDIQISGGEGRLQIESRSGIVRVTEQQGPVQIRADGPALEASWSKFTKTDKVLLHNETGPVRLYLPPNGRCLVKAEAPYGDVETEVAGIEVADDGRSAGGEYTGGRSKAPQVKKPVIQVTSGGDDIYIGVSAVSEKP